MSNTSLVRTSRDGDQFHYLWAATRCLKLLSATDGLMAISIEGPSPNEQVGSETIVAGEELIDIAEYYGDEDIVKSTLVRYLQLKHSTLHIHVPWTASGLEKTIKGFASRYVELRKTHASDVLARKLEFGFVTNRPISKDVIEAVADSANGVSSRHPGELKKLEEFTALKDGNLSDFCKLLNFVDRQDAYWDQRSILFQEVRWYLPDGDVDAPTQLKELVTRRALSEGEKNPVITKIDVLRTLKTDESKLFPAICLIENNSNVIFREQELEIAAQIVSANHPVIIHASGGMGKSILASQIGRHLPADSICILYDCFGNGQYRSATGYRHRHKDALVQMANELASKGLCHPLIPTINADSSAYVHAFLYRLTQVVQILRAFNANSLLCIVVDAADNAQMAAVEIGEARSFVLDLIREKLPDGVRLVFTCRTHRQELLNPPVDAIPIELKPFSQNESTDFLRQKFPEALERDIDEFHRLSSQNPRVQALALSRNLPLQETLKLLGPNPTSVEDTIARLLDKAILKLKDASGPVEKERVEKICAAMAVLRPLIPIPILAAISGIEQEAIKSFVYDIQRPLLVAGDTIQFLDEPAETWFREKYKPTVHAMAAFINVLKPLANKSAYVASVLPPLMLEAGQFSDLVELALSSAALPDGSPLEKRDVELQRLQFALKAGLRSHRYVEAAKLALKAGGETAGENRQSKLLQENTDLASEFLELNLIQEIVFRRTFSSGWTGAHHAYGAALLSGQKELIGDARSRLRMAYEWLRNWSRMPPDERENEEVTYQDITELFLAQLNIDGAERAVENLGIWTPQDISYSVGRLVVRRLTDHGRWNDIDAIACAAGSNLHLILAVAVELRAVNKLLPKDVAVEAIRLLSINRIKLKDGDEWDHDEDTLYAMTALVENALKQGVCTSHDAVAILKLHLPPEPPKGLASRFSKVRIPLLRAYCLHAALVGTPIELIDVAHAALKKEIGEKNTYSTSRDLQEFQQDIGALLPWYKLWALNLLGLVKAEVLPNEIKKTSEISRRAEQNRYREEFHTHNEIALVWFEILHLSNLIDKEAFALFTQWKTKLNNPLFTQTLNALCRLASQREETKSAALSYATECYNITKNERSSAESKADEYLKVARAILYLSKADAKAYFNEAMSVAGKIGDENLARWNAILDLADKASRIDRPVQKIAYQFARCAELTYEYVYRDKHFAWNDTVVALCGLCPSSAMAILSRWRDRDFGWHERLLPIAIENLIERNIVDPRDAFAMIGFRAQWDFDTLLDSVLTKSENFEEKNLVSQILYRYVQFSDSSSSTLKNIQSIVKRHGITLEQLDEEVLSSERVEAAKQTYDAQYEISSSHVSERKIPQWQDIFANKDLSTVDGISQSYSEFRKSDAIWGRENFLTELMQRVHVGSEAGFIEAYTSTPDFNLYSVKPLFDQVPESWKGRPAITHALAKAVRILCRRFCMDVRKYRGYGGFPFKLASSLAEVSESEMIDIALTAIAKAPDPISTERLFSLLGMLTDKLSHDEALEVLAYGLDLFNTTLEENDGDGPWNNSLASPDDARESIAGYIWSAMAAPEAVIRWDAAHAALNLCRLNRHDILGYLIKMAIRKSGQPFVDASLPYYELHAFQWLLIALARAALEIPSAVAPYGKQLVDWALNGQSHVMIRQFAARAALELIKSGSLIDENGLADSLKGINTSLFPFVETKSYERNNSSKHEKNTGTDENRFYFGIDTGPYWYGPLGRVFALSEDDIKAEALKVIRKDFILAKTGRWDEDERVRRKLYEEQHTYHSHGSSPRADNFQFYLIYHAMMIVAGNLLATLPTHLDSEYGETDEFLNWLSRHDLTRTSGWWLSDRRDREPLTKGIWTFREKGHPDHDLITDGDFYDAFRSQDRLILWGHWTEANADCEQSTSIRSALVTTEKSESLLRALSSAKDAHDYSIPAADDRWVEISESGFELKGWILDQDCERKLDEYDRWAGGVSFPPSCPAPFFVEKMKINSDLDLRFWKDKRENIVIESQVWGYYDEGKRNERSNPNRGNRLQVSSSFMTSTLYELDYDLIIEIQIDRRPSYRPYKSDDTDDNERIKDRTKLFLLKKDGTLLTS